MIYSPPKLLYAQQMHPLLEGLDQWLYKRILNRKKNSAFTLFVCYHVIYIIELNVQYILVLQCYLKFSIYVITTRYSKPLLEIIIWSTNQISLNTSLAKRTLAISKGEPQTHHVS